SSPRAATWSTAAGPACSRAATARRWSSMSRAPTSSQESSRRAGRNLQRLMADTISFARGAPSLDIVDVDGLREAAARAFANDPGGTTAYGTAIGYPKLREWIAAKHGVDPSNVMVT